MSDKVDFSMEIIECSACLYQDIECAWSGKPKVPKITSLQHPLQYLKKD